MSTVPTSQTPVPSVYVPWLGKADTNSRPDGSLSRTVTPVAVSAPRFESVIVNVMMSPTFGVASLTCLSMARSAYCGVSVTLAVLFSGSGSYSVPETVAVFVTGKGLPLVGLSTVAVMNRTGKSEVVSVPTVQVITRVSGL